MVKESLEPQQDTVISKICFIMRYVLKGLHCTMRNKKTYWPCVLAGSCKKVFWHIEESLNSGVRLRSWNQTPYNSIFILRELIDFGLMIYFFSTVLQQFGMREHSGSVVECLTRDQGAVGLSLTGVCHLRCVLQQDTFIPAKYWFNPGRPVLT